MHLTHFILQLYGTEQMVKDHSSTTTSATLSICSKGYFNMHHPFSTPVVEHWLKKK